ncbi:MAG TPA: OmpA family protein [Chitinophagales bacterium]|jgi:chemotaxis protein MotB|nr:OmpA family protein [Chitinophagales bacterium]MBP6155367.1 OmpA family protein [Chitinophagales bacterium]HQV78214.1 OmpA family protein [Chitinophagales bacterium]HQW79411.1 OmpA family protein [Chitinophagales bacterium]HRB18716.1 OmpA family protein [Chitinophagales bacterium]
MKKIGWILVIAVTLTSCVTKKKFQATQLEKNNIEQSLRQTTSDLAECEKKFGQKLNDYDALSNELNNAKSKIDELNREVDYQKSANGKLLDQMSALSVISKEGAESIKKSLETIDKQRGEISMLNSQIRTKDSLNIVLVSNLKRSLTDVNDTDVNVKVDKGVVLISLSDNMLYKTGSSEISSKAGTVLEKIAKVINDYKTFDVLIEGNTDNVPIATKCLTDNWDLSVMRATSIARVLQKNYGVDPSRIIAGGRSEFNPKVSNDTKANKSANRRTEIIIMPKLDEFFKLLEIKQ